MKSIYIISKITVFSFLFFLSTGTSLAQSVEEKAIQLYQEGNFREVIELLENEVKVQKENGKESSELYYNLGNAYFRDNEVAKAILNYERALLINPGDKDIRSNLEFARTRIEDKIVPTDTFFLQSWFESLEDLQSSNAWAKLSIVLFISFMIVLAAFFFGRLIIIKKIAFYSGIVTFVLLIFTNVFSARQKNKITAKNTAIIMAGSVPIMNSPDSNGKELFILHSGTKVKITKEDISWLEIEIENGNVGWITRDKLEII